MSSSVRIRPRRSRLASRRTFGLDRPLPVQYAKWIAAAMRGDFGVSLVTQKPVAEEFALRLPVTAELAVMATAIAILAGIPFGIWGGLRTVALRQPTSAGSLGRLRSASRTSSSEAC